jgi:hypothetical protein
MNIFSSLDDDGLLYIRPADKFKLKTYTFYIVAKTEGGIISNKLTNQTCVGVYDTKNILNEEPD